MNKIELRTKNPKAKITTGANCEVLIDGTPLEGVKNFKLEVSSRGVAKATIELYGHFECNVLGELEQKNFQLVDSKDKA